MIECQFRFCNESDFITFTTRSDGKRNKTRWQSKYGIVEGGNAVVRVCQDSWEQARIVIGDDDYVADVATDKIMAVIPNPQRYEEISIKIIDDGCNIEVECSFRGNTFKLRAIVPHDGKMNADMHKIAMYNR